jgi:hypothetical protein
MFRQREEQKEIRRRIGELEAKLREKGALSPEKAMTPEELDFARFKEAMRRAINIFNFQKLVHTKAY